VNVRGNLEEGSFKVKVTTRKSWKKPRFVLQGVNGKAMTRLSKRRTSLSFQPGSVKGRGIEVGQ